MIAVFNRFKPVFPLTTDQCDQIGQFLKFLASNSLSKVAKTDFWLLGYFEIAELM